jgi:hypothetical protein
MFAENEEELAWTKVQNAISNIPEGFSPYLHHLGKYFMVLRRKENKVLPQMKDSTFSGFSGKKQFSSFLHLHPTCHGLIKTCLKVVEFICLARRDCLILGFIDL